MSSEEPKLIIEQDKKKLYIKWDLTGEQLKETFAQFGAVSEARVVPTGRIRPFAFINFENEADAAKAMTAMQGKTLTTQPLVIEYASTGPRKEKKPRAVKPAKAPAAAAAETTATTPAPAANKPSKAKAKKEKAAAAAAAAAAATTTPAAGVDGAAPAAAKKAKKPRVRRAKKDAAAAPATDAAATPAAETTTAAAPAEESKPAEASA